MTHLQEKIEALPDGARLPLGQYPFVGPIVINRPLTLDGQGATIWALRGPVATIQADGVILRNLKIEAINEMATGRPEEECALLIKSMPNVKFENVEVRGSIIGVPGEEGRWQYPSFLAVGQEAAERAFDFKIPVNVPCRCEITCDVPWLNATPRRLNPGRNEINVQAAPLAKGSFLFGHIGLLTPNFKRFIRVSLDHAPAPTAGAAPPIHFLKTRRKPEIFIFLSYAREDEEQVSTLYRQLQRAGYTVWMDVWDMLVGQNWKYAIRQVMKKADFIITCLSPQSVNKIGEIQKELRIAYAIQQRMPDCIARVLPVRLKECNIPYPYDKYHYLS